MNDLYETKISDVRWWVYDVLGNLGWILWIACTVLCLKGGVTLFSVLSCLPALLMVVGVAELIRERVAKLDRVLPRIRVWLGFGALMIGGIIGIPVAGYGWLAQVGGGLPIWMLIGALLCGTFAGLCFAGYKKCRAGMR